MYLVYNYQVLLDFTRHCTILLQSAQVFCLELLKYFDSGRHHDVARVFPPYSVTAVCLFRNPNLDPLELSRLRLPTSVRDMATGV